jgi:hypothetical protein
MKFVFDRGERVTIALRETILMTMTSISVVMMVAKIMNEMKASRSSISIGPDVELIIIH